MKINKSMIVTAVVALAVGVVISAAVGLAMHRDLHPYLVNYFNPLMIILFVIGVVGVYRRFVAGHSSPEEEAGG